MKMHLLKHRNLEMILLPSFRTLPKKVFIYERLIARLQLPPRNVHIAQMEPSLVSVEEGDIILKMGSKVTEADLEKYSKYLNLTLEDRNLLPSVYLSQLVHFCFRSFILP